MTWVEQQTVPWLIASKAIGEEVWPDGSLYPCMCEQEDPDPPWWKIERAERTRTKIYLCSPYLAKKGHWAGKVTNRCGCWGRRRDDRLPEGCCAWHDDNPAYGVTTSLGIETLQRAKPRPVEEVTLPEAPVPERTGVYRRKFAKTECTCTCPTPWDEITNPMQVGYHCVSCHTHWRSWAASVVHQRHLGPCKDPRSAKNVDGAPIARARMDGPFLIWG